VKACKRAHAVRDLHNAHRPCCVARIGTACAQILHHQQEVAAFAIDDGFVDQRVIERQLDAVRKQLRFVEQVAVAQMHRAVRRIIGFDEQRRRP
jgi:hypothetical protein